MLIGRCRRASNAGTTYSVAATTPGNPRPNTRTETRRRTFMEDSAVEVKRAAEEARRGRKSCYLRAASAIADASLVAAAVTAAVSLSTEF